VGEDVVHFTRERRPLVRDCKLGVRACSFLGLPPAQAADEAGECDGCARGEQCRALVFLAGAYAEWLVVPERIAAVNLHDVPRGVAPAHRLVHAGVNASLSTNNVLNPFTPFGDCSLIRMANLYANIAQLGQRADLALCHEMITGRAAQILGAAEHRVAVGAAADLVVLDCRDATQAVAQIATPLFAFKAGRMTMSRAPAVLHRP